MKWRRWAWRAPSRTWSCSARCRCARTRCCTYAHGAARSARCCVPPAPRRASASSTCSNASACRLPGHAGVQPGLRPPEDAGTGPRAGDLAQLLLLDEPAAGLRNREIETLDRLLTELCERDGITVLLVEHVMQLVMSISDRITVMSFGEKIAEARPRVRSNPASSKPIWARPPVADYRLKSRRYRPPTAISAPCRTCR